MAHDALHLFFLDRVVDSPGLPSDVTRLLRTHRHQAEAGALLIDVPYFEGFATKVAGHFLGKPEAPSPWGDRFHQSCAFGLLRALLDVARDQSDPGPIQAFALGHLSHAVLDVMTHPHVNRFVRGRGGEAHTQHRTIENVQLELWHRATFGRPLFGTTALSRLAPASRGLWQRRPVLNALSTALRLATGAAPDHGAWRRWTLGLWQYVALVSSPIGRRYVPESDLEELRPWFNGPELTFSDLWETAVERCVATASELWSVTQSPDGLARDRFAGRFPETNLDDPEKPPRPA